MNEEEQGPDVPNEGTYDASDPKAVNSARKKSKRIEDRDSMVIQALMQHKDGRAFLWDLIEGTSPYSWPVTPGDTHMTYLNIGIKNVGLKYLALALRFPDLYLLMAQENAPARPVKRRK